MRISDLKEMMNNSMKIVKDSEFNALGMATTKFNDEKVLAFFLDVKYLESILNNKNIVALITTKQIYEKNIIPEGYGLIISDNPKLCFYEIHNKLVQNEFYWTKFENEISETAVISKYAYIEDHSIIIGENSIIEPGVIIHSGSIIGDNVIIRSGSKIGTNGFQFLNDMTKVFSVKTGGRTIIEDDVEIQHNCCIDRGVLGGNTVLSKYVKLDNFIHVAHDCIIGQRTFITAGVKLAGRVIIGEDCWIGVNATISNGISIGNKCKITLGAVVTKNVPDYSTVSGNFAVEHSKFIKFIKSIRD